MIHVLHRNSDIHRGLERTPICGVGGVVFLHAYVTKWQSLQHVAESTWRSFNCQASSSVLRTPTIARDWRTARTCRWHAPQIHSKAWVRNMLIVFGLVIPLIFWVSYFHSLTCFFHILPFSLKRSPFFVYSFTNHLFFLHFPVIFHHPPSCCTPRSQDFWYVVCFFFAFSHTLQQVPFMFHNLSWNLFT